MRVCDAVILYALSAVYFAGVMVRLMLTLTPVVCVLAAVGFSKVFSIYLRDDSRQQPVTEDADSDKEKNDKYYDKVRFSVLQSGIVFNFIMRPSLGAALSVSFRPSVRPSVLCSRFSQNRKAIETSNVVEI